MKGKDDENKIRIKVTRIRRVSPSLFVPKDKVIKNFASCEVGRDGVRVLGKYYDKSNSFSDCPFLGWKEDIKKFKKKTEVEKVLLKLLS